MPGGINLRYTRVMPLVVERRRSQRTDRILQRRETGACLGCLAIAPPADCLLEWRPFSIGAERRTQTPRRVCGECFFVMCQQATGSSAHLQELAPARSF